MTPKLSYTEEQEIENMLTEINVKQGIKTNDTWYSKEDMIEAFNWGLLRATYPRAYNKAITETNSKWKDAVSKLKEDIIRCDTTTQVLIAIDKIFKELTSEGEDIPYGYAYPELDTLAGDALK